jgi:flagellar basal body-associated protein FliL
MKNNSGVSTIIAVLLGLLIIGVVGYFVVMNLNSPQTQTTQEMVEPTPSPVSQADDMDTLEAELEDTTTGTMDEELQTLDSEASSL